MLYNYVWDKKKSDEHVTFVEDRSISYIGLNIASETVLFLPKTFKSFLPVIWDMLNVALAENASMKIRGKSSARVEWMDAVHIHEGMIAASIWQIGFSCIFSSRLTE